MQIHMHLNRFGINALTSNNTIINIIYYSIINLFRILIFKTSRIFCTWLESPYHLVLNSRKIIGLFFFTAVQLLSISVIQAPYSPHISFFWIVIISSGPFINMSAQKQFTYQMTLPHSHSASSARRKMAAFTLFNLLWWRNGLQPPPLRKTAALARPPPWDNRCVEISPWIALLCDGFPRPVSSAIRSFHFMYSSRLAILFCEFTALALSV